MRNAAEREPRGAWRTQGAVHFARGEAAYEGGDGLRGRLFCVPQLCGGPPFRGALRGAWLKERDLSPDFFRKLLQFDEVCDIL